MSTDDAPDKDPAVPARVLADNEQDWLLARLLAVVEQTDTDDDSRLRIGVTLVVSGQTISGLLVNGRRWAITCADLLQLQAGEWGSSLATLYAQARSAFELAPSGTPVGYVHLLNAAPVAPDGVRITEGLPLRIRIQAVDAWAIGSWDDLM